MPPLLPLADALIPLGGGAGGGGMAGGAFYVDGFFTDNFL